MLMTNHSKKTRTVYALFAVAICRHHSVLCVQINEEKCVFVCLQHNFCRICAQFSWVQHSFYAGPKSGRISGILHSIWYPKNKFASSFRTLRNILRRRMHLHSRIFLFFLTNNESGLAHSCEMEMKKKTENTVHRHKTTYECCNKKIGLLLGERMTEERREKEEKRMQQNPQGTTIIIVECSSNEKKRKEESNTKVNNVRGTRGTQFKHRGKEKRTKKKHFDSVDSIRRSVKILKRS